MNQGRLSITGSPKNRKLQLLFTDAKGLYTQKLIEQVPPDEISISLTQKIQEDINQLKNVEVEFEKEGDKFKKIREKGKNWDRAELVTKPKSIGDFHNPYNFIPALPREHLQKFEKCDPRRELGDRAPSGHGCYLDNYWSGKISVTLTTVTPLLIPDAENLIEDDKGHKTYGMLIKFVTVLLMLY